MRIVFKGRVETDDGDMYDTIWGGFGDLLIDDEVVLNSLPWDGSSDGWNVCFSITLWKLTDEERVRIEAIFKGADPYKETEIEVELVRKDESIDQHSWEVVYYEPEPQYGRHAPRLSYSN